MTFPSGAGGSTTQEVGYFETDVNAFADWLVEGLGGDWRARPAGWAQLEDALLDLRPATPLSRYGLIPVKSWTLLLDNGPLGTDVGMLPSQAARDLGCLAIRAVRLDDGEGPFPARVLEVYGPEGAPPLATVRAVAVAKDGASWTFETAGKPFAFEETDEYRRPRKSDRLTGERLERYLRALGVPVDDEPGWNRAVVVTDDRV